MAQELEEHIISSQEVEDAVERGIIKAFEHLGMDATEPLEAQRDFQFLRDLRCSTESVKGKALVTIVGILVAGGLAAIWLGIKALLHSHH